MKAKHILLTVVIGSAFLAPLAFAHEAPSKHGGIVRTANDLQFELVQKGQDVVIFIDNHGKPMPTAGMTGNLVVLQGTEKTESPLQPVGENQLAAKGVKPGSGAKAIAVINTAQAKAITVRFVVK